MVGSCSSVAYVQWLWMSGYSQGEYRMIVDE